MTATSKALNIHIHWFRNDLRLHDNPALSLAYSRAKTAFTSRPEENTLFLPFYCFDERFIHGTKALSRLGQMQKCGALRAKFQVESVQNLRDNLDKAGFSPLCVAQGKTEDALGALIQSIQKHCSSGNDDEQLNISVYCQQEVCSEELAVDKQVKRVLKQLRQKKKGSQTDFNPVWGSTLYLPKDLPYRDLSDMPDTFTPFRNKVEKNSEIRSLCATPNNSPKEMNLLHNNSFHSLLQDLEQEKDINNTCSIKLIPSLQDLGYTTEEVKSAQYDGRGVMNFIGGESQGLHRVQDYIWDKDLLKVYFDTRNGMLGADYSTKFAPWLANGCLSPRFIANECKKYEESRVANKSTYWVVFELLWRDFFKFFALKHDTDIFQLDGTLGEAARGSHPNSRRWSFDPRHYEAWRDGETGYPLVDANMRELAATGFMSNRGRQNVCSFLTIDMKTDWRYGAEYFEETLLDFDVHSNWGNWCMGAGMTGGRLNRFNIVKQSKDYDCEGDYVRHWIPELSNVPTKLIHEPWKLTLEQQKQYGVRLGVDYPNPIIKPSDGPPPGGKSKGGRQQNNGGRKGDSRSFNEQNSKNKNRNLGRGQRKEMKSLKQGSYNFKSEWSTDDL